MSNNSDIDSFINTYIKNTDIDGLDEDIENVFNNILNETCYIYYDTPTNMFTLVGISESINVADFTYLVPNLFRTCYAQNQITFPYFCPTYTNPTNTENYYPILINTNLIKSFLYFNFPGSIKNFNNNYDFIKSIYLYMTVKNIKMTYASYTSPIDIISSIYSRNSLLMELISFNKYINDSSFANSNSLLVNNFNIKWDFTKYCVTYTKSASTIFTIGNFTLPDIIITQDTAFNLYTIQNSVLYLYKNNNDSITQNGLIVLQNYSIYKILDIANSVLTDICEEIQYYSQNKIYCKKTYMNTYNIPILLKIYKNYYNNQLYTISKNLTSANLFTVTPSVISITTYVNEFISIYLSSYSDRYVAEKIFLTSGIDAIVIFSNIDIYTSAVFGPVFFDYYYINIYDPSAVQLSNINTTTNNYTYTQLNDFLDDFNNSYEYSLAKQILYTGNGLYMSAGQNSSKNCNLIIGYYNNSSDILQSIIFLTLISVVVADPEPTTTIGVALRYYNKV